MRDSANAALTPFVSMGQPSRWLPYVSGTGLLGGGDGYLSAALGIYHPIGSPVNGLLGLGMEATGQIGQQATAGLRLLEVTRALNFAV